MSDPYAAVARPVAQPRQTDPYAGVARPVSQARPWDHDRLRAPAVPVPQPDVFARLGDTITESLGGVSADIRDNAATGDFARDARREEGFLDRAGSLLERGGARVDQGLYSAIAALTGSPKARTAADALVAGTTGQDIEGTTSWEDLKARPNMASLGSFILEGGIESVPSLAALAVPYAGPALVTASQTGNIATERAANDGGRDVTAGDMLASFGPAALSTYLDKLSLGRMAGVPTGGSVASRIGGAAATEGGTEATQSAIEYAGGSVGTDAGFDPAQAGEQALAGAIIGAPLGGAVRTGAEGVGAIRSAAARQASPAEADPYAAIAAPAQALPAPDPIPAASAPAPTPSPVDPQPAPVQAVTIGNDGSGGLGTSTPAPPAPAPVAAAPGPAPSAPPADGERDVRTPAGGTVRTRMEVVEAGSLAQAEGANQNRDRSRETTDLQVQNIISNFDPELLGEDPSSDRGAPIVGPDNAIDSGNGRMLALNRIYDAHPEQAARYRAMIEARGFKTEGMERPVLVQRRVTDMTPEQRRQFVIDSNKDTKLELSPVERAQSDADAITPEMLATYAGGDLNATVNAGFVQAFNSRLTAGEMGNMIGTDRRLTTAGAQRIENAVVAAAYGKPKLLERMMESTQDDIRSITGSLSDVAGAWARMRASVKAGDLEAAYDITDDLADAAARVSDARKRGIKPADLLSQQDAFDQMSPATAELIRAFHNGQMTRAASRKAVSEFLADYLKAAQAAETTEGLFGAEPAKAPADILRDMLSARDNPNGATMFDAPATKETADAITAQPERAPRQDRGNADEDGGASPESAGRAEPAEAEGQDGERAGRRSAPRRDESLDEIDEDRPDYTEGRPALIEDRGPYDPSFETASFTNRTSIFNSAAEALGMDPDKFTLLDPARQVALLRKAMLDRFGVEVTVDEAMQQRFAIDQMLDAYQNVQGMAHVLELPATGISLGGKLKLRLQRKGKFLGAFQPGTSMIMLPKRSNSFAHEWGHALDWHLLSLAGEDGKGLTGAVRRDGAAVANGDVPANVREAFVALLNAMFFDKAGAAETIMRLEAKIAQTKSAKVKAQSQAQIDRLKDGSSQAKSIRSAFYKGAKEYDGEGGDYWTSPTEMFARAFEAFVSYKVEAVGLTTEFIGKGDAGYLSNAEERFAKTFPKGEERRRIFAAFELLFGHIGDEAVLGTGTAAKPEGGQRKLSDYSKTPAPTTEGGVIARELAAIKRSARQAQKEAADRAESPKGTLEKIADLNGAVTMSMTGNLRMIQARSGSKSLQKLIDLLTKQDGRGDRTVARTFAEDVHLQSHATRNKITNILKANQIDLEGRTPGEDIMLRDLLTGALDPSGKSGPFDPEGSYDAHPVQVPQRFVKAAAAIRHVLDEEFYVNQRAGIDLGYTRNGYLQRVFDMPKVYSDGAGFVKQASKVYEIVFDNEFGTEAGALLANDEAFPRFMKLAAFLAKQGHDIDSLGDVRALLKQINKLAGQAAKAEGDVADGLNAQVAKLTDDLTERLGELMGEVRPAFAQERAEAWLAKMNLVAGEEHNAASPDSAYTKSRTLPPEADKLMEKFYLSDPIEGVTNYLVQSARRTAYARRFGTDGKRRKELFEGMAAEGVSPDDQRTVEQILDIATGRKRSELNRAVQSGLAFINAAGTMVLLPRAMLSSLAEPFASGLVTGDIRSGFRLLGMMIGSALGSPSGKTRFELARALGIVEDGGSNDIMMARYGQTYADATRWDRYVSEMFKATGLTGLTRAQKTHAIGLGHSFLDNQANAILTGEGPAKENATALLRELGVRDPEGFAKEMVARGRMPAVDELDSEFGHDYATAQLRFSNMVIQNPDAMDRPELSQNPVGRVIYGITGFSYAFWRNIIKRNGILIGQMGKRDKARAALYTSGLFASAATLYLMQLTVSTIREYLLNPSRWEELEEEGELESTMAALAFTRTFPLGAADPPIQAWTGLKYQRDFSNMFVGPGPGYFLQSTQKVAQLRGQSRKTNTGEFNALQGAYQLGSPLLAFGIARIPGGPVINVAKGAGIATLTSSAARDTAAGAIVGEKQEAGERKPTAYDELLNKAFPKDE